MKKYTFRLLAILGVLAIVLVGGVISFAEVNNPADPSTVQTPIVGNIDYAGFDATDMGNVLISDTNYIQMAGGTDIRLVGNSSDFGAAGFVLDGTNGSSTNRWIGTSGGFILYANTNSDGSGNWEPNIQIKNDGKISAVNTTQGTAGSRFFSVEMTDGLRVNTGGLMIGSATAPDGTVQLFESASTTLVIGDRGTSKTACIVMEDSDAGGTTYITTLDGVLSATTTQPAICQ